VASARRRSPLTWIICGAGRRVGKTHLARRLADALPNSTYVKQGHGRPKRGKCPAFFRSSAEAREHVEASGRQHDHVVVESNALAREGFGDVLLFVEAPPGRSDVRDDAAALRAAADVTVSARPDEARWRRALRRVVPAGLAGEVVAILADHAAFLARCRLSVGVKLWLQAGGGHAFGQGLADLLEGIARAGSLTEAARACGMSYRYAWKLIRSAEGHLGRPLVHARPGGSGGGGSALSVDGERLAAVFATLKADVTSFAAKRFAELYGKDGVDG